MQFVFQFEENIDFNMTTAKLTNLTEFATDENNSSGTPLERRFNTHIDGIAQKTYFLQIFVTTSIGVKMAKNLLVTLLVTSVKYFTNDKPRYKQKIIRFIRRNQVYFSSSNVSTDTTVIVKDYKLSEKFTFCFKITIKWNLTKSHATRIK